MTKLSSMGNRMKITMVFIVLGFCYLAWHLYVVQIERHEDLYKKARRKYTFVKKMDGKRGEIFDYSGSLLVGNVPCADVCADPSIAGDEKRCREIAVFLAKALELKPEDIYEKLMEKTFQQKDPSGKIHLKARQYTLIKGKVDFEIAEKLKQDVEKRGYKPAVYFQETFKRSYPKKELLANILGFTTIDRNRAIAVVGLEKFFDSRMQASQAFSTFERSRDGLPIVYGNSEQQNVQDGFNLYLTIREPIQAILEEELDSLMERCNPDTAYAVMADPYTGDIIAAAQRPTYDPNDRRTMKPAAWRNRIAEDIFEPGSTMKPFAVAGALDLGVVRPETRFDCEKGHWYYGGKRLKDSHPMGRITVSDIIQQSSNIGTAKIAIEMGENNLDHSLRLFGFGERTGIPLKPETIGRFRPVKNWDKLSITRFPIGQGIAVSPFQLVRGYCILANGGYPVRLRLVDRIENPTTGIIQRIPIEREACIFRRPETHHEIVTMMKRVTAPGGTAKQAAVPGYSVAGKTGTAEIFDVKTHQYTKKYFASFVGFVPADRPRFVLLVTTENPKGAKQYGGSVAGPSFSAICSKTLRYMNIPPETDLPDLKKNNRSYAENKALEKSAPQNTSAGTVRRKKPTVRSSPRGSTETAARQVSGHSKATAETNSKKTRNYKYITFSN